MRPATDRQVRLLERGTLSKYPFLLMSWADQIGVEDRDFKFIKLDKIDANYRNLSTCKRQFETQVMFKNAQIRN